jgi:hypothetical protein
MKISCSIYSYRLSIMRKATFFVAFMVLLFFFLSILNYVHCHNLLPDEVLDFNLTLSKRSQGLLTDLMPGKTVVRYSTIPLFMNNLLSLRQSYHNVETFNRVFFPLFLLTTIILS